MARIVKEYDERYGEFLNVAQQLFYSKGYEQTSVKEIIDAVGVAKGTFYHYFDSKGDLLDALVEKLVEDLYTQLLASLEPVLADETIGGAEKFERLFTSIGNWKAANKAFVLESVRVFYQDQNVLLRSKMQAAATARFAPLFAKVISQGVAEGSFDVAYPAETAQFVLMMDQGLSESIARLVLTPERDEDAIDEVKRKLVTYERNIERILGAAANSLELIDLNQLDIWFPT